MIPIHRREEYLAYIKWKYSVGLAGTREICWYCYKKRKSI